MAYSLLFTTLFGILINVGLLFGLYKLLGKKISNEFEKYVSTLKQKIDELDGELLFKLKEIDNFATIEQLESVIQDSQKIKEEYINEKQVMASLEEKLDVCQKDIEAREAQHNDLKSIKESDEAILNDFLSQYSGAQSDFLILDQELAAIIKEFDLYINSTSQTEINEECQRISELVTEISSFFISLVDTYKTLNTRINGLLQQHFDLEEEFAKLIEKRLGI
jgi:hypothetical protein